MLLPLMSRKFAAVALLAAAAGSLAFVATAGRPAFVDDDAARTEREAMVKSQLEGRGIKDRAVLEAIRKVPRHRFVPEDLGGAPTTTGRSPSARGRRSPSPISWGG